VARQSRATAIDSAPFGARFKISDISDITNRKQKIKSASGFFTGKQKIKSASGFFTGKQ